ncbi:MAG: DUF3048 domain-containing protein [Chloroflexia bacterium]|nr:DUF3048 domain-containing protein [Chloroflexia bacterium]
MRTRVRFWWGLLCVLGLCVAPLHALATGAAVGITLPRGGVYNHPITVMIDNHVDAVPQSGFNNAAIVFEALAEGGITRFMMLFNGDAFTPNAIGPVRSTRLYFGQLAMGFKAVHVHAGGSPQGLALLANSTQIIDIDALRRGNGAPFYRTTTNVAPHNLFTSANGLMARITQKGVGMLQPNTTDANGASLPVADPDVGYVYHDDGDPVMRPSGQRISYYFLNRATGATWVYDPSNNTYGRTVNGKIARDANTKAQITAKNIIVMEVPSQRIMGDPKGRMDVEVIGKGPAVICQDGLVFDVEWRKESAEAPLRFYYLDGVTEVSMVRGQMWITVLPTLTHLSVN